MRINISKVRQLMEKRNLNQRKLAQRMGYTEGAISRRLNEDDIGCTFATVEKLAQALGVQEKTLISWEHI